MNLIFYVVRICSCNLLLALDYKGSKPMENFRLLRHEYDRFRQIKIGKKDQLMITKSIALSFHTQGYKGAMIPLDPRPSITAATTISQCQCQLVCLRVG